MQIISFKMADEEGGKHRLEVMPTRGDPDDETCATFVMHEEDHTLGNSLRYIVMKNPNVKVCGYTLPHPSENKINLRIQTNGVPATDVLRRGLSELSTVCEHVLATFEASVEEYKKAQVTSRRDSGSMSSSDHE